MTSSLDAPPAEFFFHPSLSIDTELPLNSRLAMTRREETAIELLVHEILHFDPELAEQLALDGLNRLRH